MDENPGKLGVELLTTVGHDVPPVAAQGLCSCADDILISICKTEGRRLVTLDKEFGNPLVHPPQDYSGIVVIHLPTRPAPKIFCAKSESWVRALDNSPVTEKLWTLYAGRLREYQGAD